MKCFREVGSEEQGTGNSVLGENKRMLSFVTNWHPVWVSLPVPWQMLLQYLLGTLQDSYIRKIVFPTIKQNLFLCLKLVSCSWWKPKKDKVYEVHFDKLNHNTFNVPICGPNSRAYTTEIFKVHRWKKRNPFGFAS